MKKLYPILIFATGIFLCNHSLAQNTFPATGSAGIGTSTPDASSLLEIKSTTKGVLVPRMTKSQRDAIGSPATGLLLYQTNSTPGFYYYSGTAWTAISAKGWGLKGNSGTNASINFIGTTDAQPLIFKVNNQKAGLIDFSGAIANTSFGFQTLNSNTGSYNSAFGYQALASNTTGSANMANGPLALFTNTSGNFNTANGVSALYFNTTGSNNTATGLDALYENTTGDNNTAGGYQALFSNSNGSANTANGYGALAFNTNGGDNTANGMNALLANTTAGQNVAIGVSALQTQSFSNGGVAWNSENIAVGHSALYSNQPVNDFTGHRNMAIGRSALFSNSTGSGNVASGYSALNNNTTGSDNTASGDLALSFNTTGLANTAIGSIADGNAGNYQNSSAFGNASLFTASNQVRIGNGTVTSIGGFVNFTNISDGRFKKNIREDVNGLEFINKLRPVTYTLDISGINTFLRRDMPVIKDADGKIIERPKQDADGVAAKEKITYSGFIAQEVEKAAKDVGYDFSGVDAPKNDRDVYGLRYAEFVVPLVKAVQELSKQNDDLKKEVEELKASIVKSQSSTTDGLMRSQVSPFGGDLEGATLLGQNVPNPFDNSTLIPFRIPKDCRDASMMITNTSTSEVISVIQVAGNEDHVSIDAGKLASGTYSYSLIVNGILVETKQMTITK